MHPDSVVSRSTAKGPIDYTALECFANLGLLRVIHVFPALIFPTACACSVKVKRISPSVSMHVPLTKNELLDLSKVGLRQENTVMILGLAAVLWSTMTNISLCGFMWALWCSAVNICLFEKGLLK